MQMEKMRMFVLMVTVVVPFGLAFGKNKSLDFRKRDISQGADLNQKWMRWSQSLDFNSDQVITSADVKVITTKFFDRYKDMSAEKVKKIENDLHDWWTNNILTLTPDGSFDQFVKTCQKDYGAVLTQKLDRCFNVLFGIFDTNDDKRLNLEEYRNANEAFGNKGIVGGEFHWLWGIYRELSYWIDVDLAAEAWTNIFSSNHVMKNGEYFGKYFFE